MLSVCCGSDCRGVAMTDEVGGTPVTKVHIMEFEREFLRTRGADLGPYQCYEASYLHTHNDYVKRECERLAEKRSVQDS